MTKGFYNLTSGMLSQSRRLDVVANNMTNLSTPGYKSELYTDSTFEEVLVSRVGNKDKTGAQVIGGESYILAPSQLYVDYSAGVAEETLPRGLRRRRGSIWILRSRERVFLPSRPPTGWSTPATAALPWTMKAI